MDNETHMYMLIDGELKPTNTPTNNISITYFSRLVLVCFVVFNCIIFSLYVNIEIPVFDSQKFEAPEKVWDPFEFHQHDPQMGKWRRMALAEINQTFYTDFDYATFPKSFYKKIEKMNCTKIYDYTFIGGLKVIRQNFTKNSYLEFTDENTKKNWITLGEFDHTLTEKGFNPKEFGMKSLSAGVPLRTVYHSLGYFDRQYYQRMCQSKFVLTPAGDMPWSKRFYEALMTKAIPIVKYNYETYRSEAEMKLDYKYFLWNETANYQEEIVRHNYNLFLKYHPFMNYVNPLE